MNHYPRHIGDFAAATQGLTLAERGAYTALLDQYYAHELPLPADKRECYRMAVATSAPERKAVDYVLARYFTIDTDGWHQKRADAELVAYHERSESATRSINARWAKRNTETDTNVSKTYDERNTSRKPVAINQKPVGQERVARKRATPPAKSPLPPDFALSDRVKAWAAEGGHGNLEARLEHFIGKARANGYNYVDWDEAFMGAIRDDWAKLTGKPAGNVTSLSQVGQQTANNLKNWLSGDRNGTDGS